MVASGGGLCKRGHRFAQEVVGALYGHALAGVRVDGPSGRGFLSLTAASPLRVVVGGSAASMDKTNLVD